MAAPPVHEFFRFDRCTHDRGAALLSRPLIGCLAPDALSAATRRLGGPVPIGGADGKKGALNMEVKAFAGIDVGKAAFEAFIAKWKGEHPKLAVWSEKAGNVLTFYGFPAGLRRLVYANNRIESFNKRIMRMLKK